MELRTRQVGPWGMNTYALVCPQTQESVLIDPGADADTLSGMIAGTTPVAILLTHTHPDHVGALDEMVSRLQVPLLAHEGPHLRPLDKTRSLVHGDTIKVGNHTLRVHHTPGHIADQICFEVEGFPIMIVGDTVFAGGPGKTWSIEGFQESLQTIKHIVLTWADNTICYPGHGPLFRLGDKRMVIEAFVKKDHGNFFGDATWDM